MSVNRERMIAACPGCGESGGARYGPEQVCWVCWSKRHGGDGSIAEPAATAGSRGRVRYITDDDLGGAAGDHDGAADPARVLADSRVDLVQMIREGIPEPARAPGASYLLAGKRYLIPAAAGLGKSLTLLVISVDVVAAGGDVVILDVENGAEEYARRLDHILQARDDPDASLALACRERLRYHAWPLFSLTWRPEAWRESLGTPDVVIFDSSRMALTSVGLAENVADDYARFMGALIVPLSRAGVTTIVADNTGHEHDRARGTKAKEDLNEVVYNLKLVDGFGAERTGRVALARGRCRFTDVPRTVYVPLGGGIYGPAVVADDDGGGDDGARSFRPTRLMQRTSEALERSLTGLSNSELRDVVKGKEAAKSLALVLLTEDGYVEKKPVGREVIYRSVRPYREDEE